MEPYAANRSAAHEYQILETLEAGISLLGFEVKAIRAGKLTLHGSYVTASGDELRLTNAAVAPYQAENTPRDYRPDRPRKLLLHRQEIERVIGKTRTGLTVVPLRVYSKNGKIKILIGLAKRRKTKDKREAIRARDAFREADRAMRGK